MNAQKLIKGVFADYTKALNIIKNLDYEESLLYLGFWNMNLGVCAYVDLMYNIDVYNTGWVRRHLGENIYWCTTPRACYTHKEIVQSLKKRIQILKTEYDD